MTEPALKRSLSSGLITIYGLGKNVEALAASDAPLAVIDQQGAGQRPVTKVSSAFPVYQLIAGIVA